MELEDRSMHVNDDKNILDIFETISFLSRIIENKVDDVVDEIHTIIWEKKKS